MLGISWGSTLGLAYAQAHPQRVNALVLALVTTTSRREVQWLTHDVGRIFPQAWERFVCAVPKTLRHLPLVDAYAALLFDPDRTVRERAARDWGAWEVADVALAPGYKPNPRFEDAEFRLRFARLGTHVRRRGGFFAEDELLRGAAVLDGIPGVLIHGRYDVSSPLETAWELSRRWKTCRLIVLDDAGHGDGDLFIPTLIDALNQFARAS